MDIRVAVSRTGIVLSVYSFVLILPFWLGYRTGQWIWAVGLMGGLATLGPLVYNRLREKAEKILLREQIRYQHALRKFARSMTQIKKMEELLNIVVNRVDEIVHPEFVGIYTFSKGKNAYVLKDKTTAIDFKFNEEFGINSSLAKTLIKYKTLVFTELLGDPVIAHIPSDTMAVPFFMESRLFGFLLLGPKMNKNAYNPQDIEIFEILSSEISLTSENCLFWEEEKTRIMREEQIRRQKAMDHFSASLAHEIDNPIFAVQCTVESLRKTFVEQFQSSLSAEELKTYDDKLQRIVNNVSRISKMIKTIREFSGQTSGEFTVISVDKVVEGFLSIMEPQTKFEYIKLEKEVETGLYIKGNKIHLEEVLINLAVNSIHAVKNNNKKEKQISFKLKKISPEKFLMSISDNGYGIDPDMKEDIFLDFVTTKASTEGSGMGLARARKIVENHGGKIWAESEGKGKGASFFIELPVA